MKYIIRILVFCLATYTHAQQRVVIDTLTSIEKQKFKEAYLAKKTLFFSTVEKNRQSKEAKKIKAIFEDNYTDIQKGIDNHKYTNKSGLNDYLNNLLKLIKDKNPDIPKGLNILVSREFEPNASNRGEGTIIINNYLLNALDNEDQLLFVICHEIAHQSLNHVLHSVEKHVRLNDSDELKAKTKQLQKQKYGKKTEAFELLKSLSYKNSKENRVFETQADSLGYVYYSKLGRNKMQIARTLENLRDSDTPTDSLLTKDYQAILKSLGINAKDEWFKTEDYNQYNYDIKNKFDTDSLRTHPNIETRIAHLVAIDNTISIDTTKLTFTNSTEFELWKKNVVDQSIYNAYISKRYGNSLYQALKSYKKAPSDFLKKWIALNFEQLYLAKKAYQLNRYVSQVNINEYTTSYNLYSSFIFNLSLADFEYINTQLSNTTI